jgi:MFS family permease
MIRIPPSLKHRRFFYLWLGQLLSIAGTQMQIWALFWHIRTLTDQPIALGGVGLARILPIVFFSLVGGVIADSFDRRRSCSSRNCCCLAARLGLLAQFGQIVWLIYA